jgi:hypothetical protein
MISRRLFRIFRAPQVTKTRAEFKPWQTGNGGMKIKVEPDSKEPKWMKFFYSQSDMEIDLDRTLSISQDGEVEDFAAKYLARNYLNLKLYQLIRSLKVIRNRDFIERVYAQMKKRIQAGDQEITPEDVLFVLNRDDKAFLHDPFLKEFILNKIGLFFPKMDFGSQMIFLNYQFIVNRVSSVSVELFLEALRSSCSDERLSKRLQSEASSEEQLPFESFFKSEPIGKQLVYLLAFAYLALFLKRGPDMKYARNMFNVLAASVCLGSSRTFRL